MEYADRTPPYLHLCLWLVSCQATFVVNNVSRLQEPPHPIGYWNHVHHDVVSPYRTPMIRYDPYPC